MAFYNQGASTPIEWNSNALVLQRMNQMINMINTGIITKDLNLTIDGLRGLYKEISVDLTTKEDEIWKDIEKIIKLNNPSKDDCIVGYIVSEGKLWRDIDLIDVRLRRLAKIHGYLTSNKDDPRKAILRR